MIAYIKILAIFVAEMDDRISKRIVAFRRFEGLSQRELSERCGISVTTLNRIEKGGDATLSTVRKIERGLGMLLY